MQSLQNRSMSQHNVSPEPRTPEREFFIDNLLVRIHFIIVMIRWTGLSLNSLFQVALHLPSYRARCNTCLCFCSASQLRAAHTFAPEPIDVSTQRLSLPLPLSCSLSLLFSLARSRSLSRLLSLSLSLSLKADQCLNSTSLPNPEPQRNCFFIAEQPAPAPHLARPEEL